MMKTRKITAILAIAATTLFFASCNEGVTNVEESLELAGQEKSFESTTAPGDSCDFSGTLTEDEIKGLLEMREEEKLARDVYKKLYEVHNMVIFNNISKSENAHTSAVLHLLNGYGIEDPALEGEGEFSNPAFANLYKELTDKGAESLDEALKVGAFIEEYDIADLWRLLDETQNENIKRVYGNLLRGSNFHLRAFTNVLKLRGVTYEPTIITQEEFEEIVNVSDDDDQETDTTTTPPGTCDGTGPNA